MIFAITGKPATGKTFLARKIGQNPSAAFVDLSLDSIAADDHKKQCLVVDEAQKLGTSDTEALLRFEYANQDLYLVVQSKNQLHKNLQQSLHTEISL